MTLINSPISLIIRRKRSAKQQMYQECLAYSKISNSKISIILRLLQISKSRGGVIFLKLFLFLRQKVQKKLPQTFGAALEQLWKML